MSAANPTESGIKEDVHPGGSGAMVRSTTASTKHDAKRRAIAASALRRARGRGVTEESTRGDDEDVERLREVWHKEVDGRFDNRTVAVMSSSVIAPDRHTVKYGSTSIRPQTVTPSQDTESTPVYSSHADDPDDSDYCQSTQHGLN